MKQILILDGVDLNFSTQVKKQKEKTTPSEPVEITRRDDVLRRLNPNIRQVEKDYDLVIYKTINGNYLIVENRSTSSNAVRPNDYFDMSRLKIEDNILLPFPLIKKILILTNEDLISPEPKEDKEPKDDSKDDTQDDPEPKEPEDEVSIIKVDEVLSRIEPESYIFNHMFNFDLVLYNNIDNDYLVINEILLSKVKTDIKFKVKPVLGYIYYNGIKDVLLSEMDK